MPMFMVTIKLSKNADHDPHNKVIGVCPAAPGKVCSDSTGEHHTLLWMADSGSEAEDYMKYRGLHVTRVEQV